MKKLRGYVCLGVVLAVLLSCLNGQALAKPDDVLAFYGPTELLVNETGMFRAVWNGPEETLEWSWNVGEGWTVWQMDQNFNYSTSREFMAEETATRLLMVRARMNFNDALIYTASTEDGVYLGTMTLIVGNQLYMDTSIGVYPEFDTSWNYLGSFEVNSVPYELDFVFMNRVVDLDLLVEPYAEPQVFTTLHSYGTIGESTKYFPIDSGDFLFLRSVNVAFRVTREYKFDLFLPLTNR